MKTHKAVALVGVAVVAGYLLWRLNEAKGGAVTFVNPFQPATYLPGEPSPAGSDGGGVTNPFSGFLQSIQQAFKAPGNMTATPALIAAPGTPVNPIGPPGSMTKTAQPERSPFLTPGDDGYVENLGDPNFSTWNYLASTPPDLAWGIKA